MRFSTAQTYQKSNDPQVVRDIVGLFAVGPIKSFELRQFRALTPDSFLWSVWINGKRYLLYEEDWVENIPYVKRMVEDETLLKNLQFVKAADAKPNEQDDFLNYSVESGTHFLAFLLAEQSIGATMDQSV